MPITTWATAHILLVRETGAKACVEGRGQPGGPGGERAPEPVDSRARPTLLEQRALERREVEERVRDL